MEKYGFSGIIEKMNSLNVKIIAENIWEKENGNREISMMTQEKTNDNNAYN